MDKPTRTAPLMLVSGLVLFTLGMSVDVAQHGLEFVLSEFRHAPWAQGLPLGSMLLILVGTLRLRSSAR